MGHNEGVFEVEMKIRRTRRCCRRLTKSLVFFSPLPPLTLLSLYFQFSILSPIFQSSQISVRITVWISLLASLVLYGHFCWKVVTTITTEREYVFLVRPSVSLILHRTQQSESGQLCLLKVSST